MRAILGVVIAIALLWGGYWFWGAAAVKTHTQVWMSEQGAMGDISVIGFPNRFDLTVTNPALQRDGLAYSAPFLQVFAMTWKPWHLIAAFAPKQEITILDQTLTVTSPHLLSSVVMNPLDGFAVQEVRLDGSALGLTLNEWHIDAAHVTAAIDLKTDPLSPRFGGRLTDFTAPVPVAGLNEVIELASFDANLHLDTPLEAGVTGQSVLSIDIHDARLNWGGFSVLAKGSFAPDAQGMVSGEINVTLIGADHVPQILVAFGLITPDQTANLAKGLAIMGGGGQFTLTLSGGAIRIGPIPLGAAPPWPH